MLGDAVIGYMMFVRAECHQQYAVGLVSKSYGVAKLGSSVLRYNLVRLESYLMGLVLPDLAAVAGVG